MIIAAFASGGAALIAKIFLALLSAARLVQKIRNVIMLEEFEQNLYESEECVSSSNTAGKKSVFSKVITAN